MIHNIPTSQEINALRDEAYENAKSHGFHDANNSKKHYLCLVLTELMEAVEADRKARHCVIDINEVDLIEDKSIFLATFEQHIKDTVEDEFADTVIRLLDYAGLYNIDVGASYYLKFILDDIDADFTYRLKYKSMSLTEFAFEMTCLIVGKDILFVLFELFMWAVAKGFDLTTHIKLKMRYNSYRERMHGKRY